MFYNANANNPAEWDYVAGHEPAGARSRRRGTTRSCGSSWQATPEEQDRRHLHAAGLLRLPRRHHRHGRRRKRRYDRRFPMQRVDAAGLDVAGDEQAADRGQRHPRVERWGNMHLQTKGLDLDPQMIGVTEQGGAIPGLGIGANLNYRRGTASTYNNSWNNNFHCRFNVSYITGSHAFKVGMNDALRVPREHRPTYRIRCPTGSTTACRTRSSMRALPHTVKNNVDQDLGLFAQDKWTINRLTRVARHPLRLSREPFSRSRRSGRRCSRRPGTSRSPHRTT